MRLVVQRVLESSVKVDGREVGRIGKGFMVLCGVEDVAICRFTEKDVVRHELVQRIIAAYEKYDNKRQSEQTKRPHAGIGGKKAYGKGKGTHRE